MVHIWQASVRGYEVDLQGIVNNACYMNYLDQARVEALLSLGINWADFHLQGFDLVLFESTLKWRSSLKHNQTFSIETVFEKSGRIKIQCRQKIIKEAGDTVLTANNIVVCVNSKTKRPCMPEALAAKIF